MGKKVSISDTLSVAMGIWKLLHFFLQRNAKEKEMYNTCRRGISNCHRIISDIIPMRKDIFKSEGIESYFRKLRRMTEAKQFGLSYDPL